MTRQSLITRAEMLREEIRQHFDNIAHWNTQTRREGDAPIDPDPDGKLQRIAEGIDRMLLEEAARSRHVTMQIVRFEKLADGDLVHPTLAYAAAETARAVVDYPILIDEAVPAGVVEMRSGDRVLSRITYAGGLA